MATSRASVVDLCSPEQRKRPALAPIAPSNNNVIEILSDSDTEDGKQRSSVARKRLSASSTSTIMDVNGTNKRSKPTNENVDGNYRAFKPAAKTADKEDDDDIVLMGSKGTNAITDFPHSREHCVIFPLAKDPIRQCQNCYCFVCDIPAKVCRAWFRHCHATNRDPQWNRERERVRKAGGPDQVAAAAPTSSVAAVPATAVARPPVPTSSTNGPSNMSNPTTAPTEYSIQALLQRVTAVYPSEVTPPTRAFRTNLKHYQKQSLAFMLDVEKSNDTNLVGEFRTYSSCTAPNTYRSCGGFLSSQVGMGKTACVLALVSSDAGQVLSPIALNEDSSVLSGKIRLKATLVFTSVSIIGQWEEEVRKHAPGLKCYRFHSSSRSKHGKDLCKGSNVKEERLKKADIIITSATFSHRKYFDTAKYVFQRIVVDESHLFGTASMKLEKVYPFYAERRWCVTATPCTNSISDLHNQLKFLGFHSGHIVKQTLQQAMPRKHRTPTTDSGCTFYASIDLLKKLMIRHTKDQQIGGSKALSLPESTFSVVMLDMSANERKSYNEAKRNLNLLLLRKLQQKGAKPLAFDKALTFKLLVNPAKTKVETLVRDLICLKRREPNMRVVVFTQYRATHAECIQAIQGAGIDTLHFSGSTSASKRDKVIEQFQSDCSGAKVFVITTRSGSVGITLTAATRVYLLEPSPNPATEIQAAGRINRLGQTSSVSVVKYAFSDSFESNVLDLHRKIAAGQAEMSDTFIPPEAVKILTRGIA